MFTEIPKTDVPTRGYAKQMIRAFYDSGMVAAVADVQNKNPNTVYASMKKAQERLRLPINIIRRKEKIYLIRKEGY